MITDAFYEEFEHYRAEVAPPRAGITGTVLGPDGAPLEGVSVRIRDISESGFRPATTREDGSFRWVLEGSTYELSLVFGLCSIPWFSSDGPVEMTTTTRGVLELRGGSVVDLVMVSSVQLSEACP